MKLNFNAIHAECEEKQTRRLINHDALQEGTEARQKCQVSTMRMDGESRLQMMSARKVWNVK